MPRLSLSLLPAWLAIPLALAGPVAAQQVTTFGGMRADTDAPVEVSADRLTVQQTDDSALFTGNVVIGQGEMRLTANEVKVIYAGTDRRRIQSLDATGNVTLVSGEDVAQASHAVYEVDTGLVTMQGEVTLVQGQNVLSGEHMVVNLADGTAEVQGRVRSVLQPGSN